MKVETLFGNGRTQGCISRLLCLGGICVGCSGLVCMILGLIGKKYVQMNALLIPTMPVSESMKLSGLPIPRGDRFAEKNLAESPH